MTDSIRANLTRDGFALMRPEKNVAEEIRKIADCLATVASSERGRENNFVHSFESWVEQLSCGLRNHDAWARQWVDIILLDAHQSISRIRESLVPKLARVAAQLGVCVDSDLAISRFRIAPTTTTLHDHRWHQDSIDDRDVTRGNRTVLVAFWIPLHDVNCIQGAVEFAIGSHDRPIQHGERDPSGRLCIPDSAMIPFDHRVVPTTAGELLAFDTWACHRTVPNKSDEARISLSVWFQNAATSPFKSSNTNHTVA